MVTLMTCRSFENIYFTTVCEKRKASSSLQSKMDICSSNWACLRIFENENRLIKNRNRKEREFMRTRELLYPDTGHTVAAEKRMKKKGGGGGVEMLRWYQDIISSNMESRNQLSRRALST